MLEADAVRGSNSFEAKRRSEVFLGSKREELPPTPPQNIDLQALNQRLRERLLGVDWPVYTRGSSAIPTIMEDQDNQQAGAQTPVPATTETATEPEQPKTIAQKPKEPFLKRRGKDLGYIAAGAGIATLLSPLMSVAADQLVGQPEPLPTPTTKPGTEQKIPGGKMPSQTAYDKQVVTQPIASKKEVKATTETIQYTDYEILDLKSTGNNLVTVVQVSDTASRIGVNDKDSQGNNIVKIIGTSPFFALSAARSASNPDIIIAVGDQARRASSGRIWYTLDGGKNWRLITASTGTMWATQITPDNKYAYISAASLTQENGTLTARLNLADGTLTNYIISGTPSGESIRALTAPTQIGTDTYVNYGTISFYTGYYEITYSPSGITAKRFNIDEGYARGELAYFIDSQNQKRVWLINADTGGYPPNNSSRRTGTIYDNINNVLTNIIQPKISLHPEAGNSNDITISTALADVAKNKGYMGVTVVGNNGEHYSRVETFFTSNPNDLTTHEAIPSDGDMPQTLSNNELVDIRWLKISSLGTKKLLFAGVTKSEYIYDPQTNSVSIVFRSGGILARDITNGVTSNKPWKKISLYEFLTKYSNFLPITPRAVTK